MRVGADRQQHRHRGVVSHDPLHQVSQNGGGGHDHKLLGRCGIGFPGPYGFLGRCWFLRFDGLIGAVATRPEDQHSH